MLRLLIFLILLVLGLFFYPNFAEEKDSACSALENKLFRIVNIDNETSSLLTLLIPTLSDGFIVRAAIHERYSDLPPTIGCIVTYYEILLDPQMEKDIKNSVKKELPPLNS